MAKFVVNCKSGLIIRAGPVTKPLQMPRFFVTPSSPCPYLPGQEERKIFTRLTGDDPAHMNDMLSDIGFRRSQNIAYRPACISCSACKSSRIPVARFEPDRTMRRTVRRNQDLYLGVGGASATLEQYQLLRKYLGSRHSDGGMANMDAFDYRMMVEDSPINTTILEFRDGGEDGNLVAASITDIVGDGLSMVYSYFDPDYADRSLGSYMILRHIQLAREMELKYVYLGYWIEGCRKMDYKTRFRPIELLGPEGWKEP